jgi:hypothetical protein
VKLRRIGLNHQIEMKGSAIAFESQSKGPVPPLDLAESCRELLSLENSARDNEGPVYLCQINIQSER